MSSNLRKEKEREFYMQHMDAFKAIGIADPLFTIKTAFFKKGKFGRQCQFFDWELRKGEDIYIEFYDNAYDGNGKLIDLVPMNKDRTLFKLKYNPYFHEEYDVIESFDSEGKSDIKYLIPVNEMMVVLSSGQEISYSLYEKRKEESKNDLPELQKSLSLFPNFEEEFSPAPGEISLNEEDESVSDILMKISLEFEKLAKKL
jgi:hypothetical protein